MWDLQWGTKVLTHFHKMAPFCIVDILIPFPCLPQPLPPQNQCWILDPQVVFFTSDNIDSGGEGIYGVYKEWSNKWIKRKVKSTHFKQVCQLLLSLIVAWQNSWNFLTPSLVSPWNSAWATSAEIPYDVHNPNLFSAPVQFTANTTNQKHYNQC